jgi:hypothetical protein
MTYSFCLDIGGTTASVSVLPADVELIDPTKADFLQLKSNGWLNQSLPSLFNHKHIQSRLNDYKKDLRQISISVPCHIDSTGKKIRSDDYYVKKNGLPIHLAQIIEDEYGYPVKLYNDACAWLSGSLTYMESKEGSVQFPAIAIPLGTGVGLALAEEREKISEVNIGNDFNKGHFKKLKEVANYWKLFDSNRVHNILGHQFFDWVKSDRGTWTNSKIKEEYTKRVHAFIYDLKHHSPLKKVGIKSFLIGGGRANYVNQSMLSSDLKENVFVFTDERINFNTSLIPLIGIAT